MRCFYSITYYLILSYGDSGIMINCENESCNKWFHDCLGLTETEILNIENFYCIECLNKNSNLAIEYIIPPEKQNTFCNCSKGEHGLMIECGKCNNWYHSECINLSQGEINQILIYFCQTCLNYHPNLKIIYKDYSKEHTKPLFTKYELLTIHNLFPYHLLLELYKVLKFRTPYCIFNLFSSHTSNRGGINFRVPEIIISIQQKTFLFQAILLWNRLYKKLLIPFTITLHKDHKLKFDLSSSDIICYDHSDKVASFKLKLKDLLFTTQCIGDINCWSNKNWVLNQ